MEVIIWILWGLAIFFAAAFIYFIFVKGTVSYIINCLGARFWWSVIAFVAAFAISAVWATIDGGDWHIIARLDMHFMTAGLIGGILLTIFVVFWEASIGALSLILLGPIYLILKAFGVNVSAEKYVYQPKTKNYKSVSTRYTQLNPKKVVRY